MTREIEVATPIILWLRKQGWTVHQEVPLYNSLVDIVAIRDGISWGIETKTSFSKQLKRQVGLLNSFVMQTSIGLPNPRRKHESHVIKLWSLRDGIERYAGVIYVDKAGIVEEYAKPTLDERDSLHNQIFKVTADWPEQEPGIAGQPSKDRESPFRQTCENLKRYILAHPECSLKDAVHNIEHHYASTAGAYSSLGHWLRHGKIKGLMRNQGKLVVTMVRDEQGNQVQLNEPVQAEQMSTEGER